MVQLFVNNYEEIILSNSRPVVIEVITNWSGDSYLIKNFMEIIKDEYESNIDFVYAEYCENEELFKKLEITRWEIPTFLFFYKGNLINKISGLQSHSTIRQSIQEFLNDIILYNKC